jgi:hypothetical protein
VSWSLAVLAEPIELPVGSTLATLRDAISHLGKTVPKSDHEMPAVLTTAELLTRAAEQGSPVEFARIATLRALNRHMLRSFNPERNACGRRGVRVQVLQRVIRQTG